MIKKMCLLIFLLIISSISAAQCAGGVCLPIIVTAPAVTGPNIICQGSGCGDMLRGLQPGIYWNLNLDQQGIYEEQNMKIPRPVFCSSLRNAKPVSCQSTPPPVPLVNIPVASFISQYANGCGDGSLSAAIASAIAQEQLPGDTGNPNAPLGGVSFLNACNADAACYAWSRRAWEMR